MTSAPSHRSFTGRIAVAALVALAALQLAVGGYASAPRPRRLDPPRHGMGSLAVEQVGRGQIRIVRGKQALRLDLRTEFEGCKGEMYDPMEKQQWPAEVTVELVDEADGPSLSYLVLLAQAASNCNIQGACGASRGESTLIWLKLTPDLKLAGTQSVLFDSCTEEREARIEGEDGGAGTEAGFSAKDLRWTGDVLRIDVDSERAGPPATWHLTYDRRRPEAGLSWVQDAPGEAARPPAEKGMVGIGPVKEVLPEFPKEKEKKPDDEDE